MADKAPISFRKQHIVSRRAEDRLWSSALASVLLIQRVVTDVKYGLAPPSIASRIGFESDVSCDGHRRSVG